MRPHPTRAAHAISAARAISLAVAVMTLAGCAGADYTSPSVTRAPSVSAEPSSPSEPSSSVSPVEIPADCEGIIDPGLYAATFGDLPLNDPAWGVELGRVDPGPATPDAIAEAQINGALELYCIWGSAAADVTQLTVSFARVDADVATTYLETLPAEGYTCDDRYLGRVCQLISDHPQYPVTVGQTVFTRDGVVVQIYQANVPTAGLTESIVSWVWA